MKQLAVIAIVALSMTACARHCDSTIEQVVSQTQTQAQQIQALVDAENQYREAQGQTELSNGLSCSVQQVASGQWISSSSPGYQSSQGVLVTTGTSYAFLNNFGFDQPNASSGLTNLIPSAIAPLFQGLNYRISCSGQIVVLETGYVAFDMNSDDGSILTIDGTQVINDDGNHGMVDKTGTKLLRSGVHTFALIYAQSGAGSFGLVLKSQGQVLDPAFLFH